VKARVPGGDGRTTRPPFTVCPLRSNTSRLDSQFNAELPSCTVLGGTKSVTLSATSAAEPRSRWK
jgi:hypothetical protein